MYKLQNSTELNTLFSSWDYALKYYNPLKRIILLSTFDTLFHKKIYLLISDFIKQVCFEDITTKTYNVKIFALLLSVIKNSLG